MCSEFDEHSCKITKEENSSNLSTSPDSYVVYNPRFTFNKKQKSSLGKLRCNRLGTHAVTTVDLTTRNGENDTDDSQNTGPFTAKTPYIKQTGLSWMRETPAKGSTPFNVGPENALSSLNPIENDYKLPDSNFEKPLTNLGENDSGLDVSCPSSIFSSNKSERPSSIFDSTICKRNIKFNTPSKDNGDKENLSPITEGKSHLNQQDSSKNTKQSTRLGLFDCKKINDFDNINYNGKKISENESNEKKNDQLKTHPQRISLFNQKSTLFENILLKSSATNTNIPQEHKEIQVKPQLQDHQPKITLFNSNSNLFQNKFYNSNLDSNNKPANPDNLEDTETSQVNKNQGVSLFDPEHSKKGNQLLSNSQESIKHFNNYDMKNETYKVPMYKLSAPKTIFDKPFIFTANSKPEHDKGNLSDESLSTPLDLSSGECLNRTNSTQQNSYVNLLENSTNNINGAVSLIGETVNDSGINVSEQVKVNSQGQLEPETEVNLLPTALVLSSRKGLMPNSGDNTTKLESAITQQSVSIKSKNTVISEVKNIDEQTPLNLEQVLSNECNKLQVAKEGVSLLQSKKSTQELLSSEAKNEGTCQKEFNILKQENIPMEIDEFKSNSGLKTDAFYLPFTQNVVDLKKQKIETNPIHQSIAKPKEEAIAPLVQSLQSSINLKPSKSEVLLGNITQKLSVNYQSGIKNPETPIQVEVSNNDNIGSTKLEIKTVIPQAHSLDKEKKPLYMLSTHSNKHYVPNTKIDFDQKNVGSQLFCSTTFNSDRGKMLMTSKPMEKNHQNLFVPSTIPLPPAVSSQEAIISKLEPNNAIKQYNNSSLSNQNLLVHQQSITSNNINNKQLLQQTPVPGHQLRLQDYQSANQLHRVINPVHSYNNSSEFIKPVNPAPRSIDRLSALKSTEPKAIINMQSNYGGISTRMNQCLYVNNKGYTILSTLGRGGSSEVYQVLDPNTSNLMAVKCVDLKGVDQSIAEGYLNEIDLLLKLQGCPTVIKMFDHEYVKETKMLYVVMEKGDTDLSKLIRDISKTTKISMSMIIYYWTEMLTAVRDIHERGIIHSDLKPANFLLVSGRLKLIDFGIASSLQGDMTSVQKEVTSGTWNYMSPEAIRNNGGSGQGFKITYRSDVWSLGCILYNLIYGKTPFSHINHTWSKLQAIADSNHKIEFKPFNIPPVLDQALKSCLQRDPKQRPTVAQLLELPYHTTFDQVSLGQEVKKLLPDESWSAVQHLFIDSKKPANKIAT